MITTIEEKGHLNRKVVRELKKKTDSPTRYLWHKDRIKSFDKHIFPKKHSE